MKTCTSVTGLLLCAALATTVARAADEAPTGARVLPVEPLSPLDRDQVLRDVEATTKRFEELGNHYTFEVRSTGMREVKARERQLEAAYTRQIEDIEALEHERRLDAITLLERFVARYPNHVQYTPDALYRLGDLYFEKSQVDGFALREQFDRDMDLYRRGKLPSEPRPPDENYVETTKLYDEILRRFPEYRLGDAVLYKQGYLLNRSGNERGAREAWEKLAITYGAKSPFTAECWLRIGEYHFDNQQWGPAKQAYTEASKYPDDAKFPMVLYKLAWTYFMEYDYDRAIKGFKDLIARYDGTTQKSKKSVLGSALRDEAIAYLARSLAEEDWDGDNEPDPDAGVARALKYLSDGTPSERQILEEYAKSLFDLFQPKYFVQAAEVYRALIDRQPTFVGNPDYQEKVVECYAQGNENAKALSERDRFVTDFNRGTTWFNANANNAAATSRADRTIELILRQRGQFAQRDAQELRASGQTDQARKYYLKAAEAYRTYLGQYGNRKDAYEIRYLLAESLYFAGEFLEASKAYAEVRDIPKQSKRLEASAFSAIASIEQHLDALFEGKKLDEKALARDAITLPSPPEDQKTAIVRATPEAIPEIALAWVGHAEQYVKLGLTHKDAAGYPITLAYRVGLLYFNYKHFDEARARFEDLIKRWPLEKWAAFAAFNIINSYKSENDWQNIEVWTDRIAKDGIGRPEDVAAVQKQVAGFKLGQKFDRAMALFEEKKFIEAAEEFERVVNEDPKSKFMDKALYNAALAFQDAKHWNSAARVFERIATDAHFAGSQYREDALFYMAENSRKFFAFGRAVNLYGALTQSFKSSERAPYALFQAARLEEMQGNFKQAVGLYRRYTTEFSSRDDSNQAVYNIARIYDRTGDKNNEIVTWKEFITRFGGTPGTDTKIVEANLRLGNLYRGKNDWKTAARYYQSTIDEFARRGLQPGTASAAFPAEARFQLVEEEFRSYERLKLSGSVANQGRIVTQKKAMLGALEVKYADVFPYKSFDWTVAGFFRIGHIYQLFAQMLYDAPDPQGLSDEEMDQYRTLIEEQAVKWENVAIQRYEVTVQNARELKIVNEWSQRALKELNSYKPAEFPLFKAERRQYDFGKDSALPIVPPPPAPEPAPDGDSGGLPPVAAPTEPVPTEPMPTEPVPTEPVPAEPAPAEPGGAP